MTEKERFIRTLLFQKTDRVPFQPGTPRESTLERWRREGLPENIPWQEVVARELGIEWEVRGPSFELSLSFSLLPEFEERVLERKNSHKIVQMHTGEILEVSEEYDFSHLRRAKDFVTRRWIKFPVENEEDWEEMRRRYNPLSPERYPKNLEEVILALRERDYPFGITIHGPFWQMREWCGMENLCMFMIDKADWVKEMAFFWRDFVLEVLRRGVRKEMLDYVIINEDMAYKEKSMISPRMVREFLLPVWSEWVEFLKSIDCPVIILDSDGYIEELIPLWIEAGINCTIPVEIAAGNDLLSFRKKFGKRMAYIGGIDKRDIARGGKSIEEEIARLLPLIKEGGYIPSCDHALPPDISWENFLYYCKLLARATGWLS